MTPREPKGIPNTPQGPPPRFGRMEYAERLNNYTLHLNNFGLVQNKEDDIHCPRLCELVRSKNTSWVQEKAPQCRANDFGFQSLHTSLGPQASSSCWSTRRVHEAEHPISGSGAYW